MAHINFVIPTNKSELLNMSSDNYNIRCIIGPKELLNRLQVARTCLKEEGVDFIMDNFDTYYSVVHHSEKLSANVIYRAFDDLQKAATDLCKTTMFLLEDKDGLNDELKMKMNNVMKMLMYVYTEMVKLIHKKQLKEEELLMNAATIGGKKKLKDKDNNLEYNELNRKLIIITINNLISEKDLNEFWVPPIIDETFINMLSDIIYLFIELKTIKSNEELLLEISNLIGQLIKLSNNYTTTFIIRITQLIKLNEHLVQVLPKCIKQLYEEFNCHGLLHDLIREITEWQTDEKYQDGQGARNCSLFLQEMAQLMPNLILPEVMYLNKYLYHESPILRISILNVLTEIIIKILTQKDLNKDERETRDELLEILYEHINDTAANVRTKCIQNWIKLQQSNAIPIKLQEKLLNEIILHLTDKSALVRKSAANCVTTFITHNIYGAELQLGKVEKEFEIKQKSLDSLKTGIEIEKMKKIEELEKIWVTIEEQLKDVIKSELEVTDDCNVTNIEDESQLFDTIRYNLRDGKFVEAVKILKGTYENFDEYKEMVCNNDVDKGDFLLLMLRTIYLNLNQLVNDLKVNLLNPNDLKEMELLETQIDFLKEKKMFLLLISEAFEPMRNLFDTQSISDLNESIEFFVTCYQFKIDNYMFGILEIMNLLKRKEIDRKQQAIKCLKKIYLQTDSKTMNEHTNEIVKRLFELIKLIKIQQYYQLELLIKEWIINGELDNSIIDCLWQIFTGRIHSSNDNLRCSAILLYFCGLGRKTIITRNVQLIITIALNHKTDILFFTYCLKLLTICGLDKINIESGKCPERFGNNQMIFVELEEMILRNFLEPLKFFNFLLKNTVEFIYRLCSKPELFIESLLKKLIEKLKDKQEWENYVIIRIVNLFGLVAINQLNFLDDSVYKELKRRNNMREKRKNKFKDLTNSNRKRQSVILPKNLNNDDTINNIINIDDIDAEFILNVLENDLVNGSGLLSQFSGLIKSICESPNIYNDCLIQSISIIALMRFMLVSSVYCHDNIQLLFTIFEKTQHNYIKCTILVHLNDLLVRFPNIIEPWTSMIYNRLKDPVTEIRSATFFTLSNLILRDMIRVHNHISELAICIIDPDIELCEMSKTFFVQLSHKDNNLFHVLPDIFSHLMEMENLTDDQIKTIISYLFNLIDKNKQMESLVDRFCCKYRLTENLKCHKFITYCLTLIQYNEKTLKKLQENFPTYKHLLNNEEIYTYFNQILEKCAKTQVGKTDLKPIVTELENSINDALTVKKNNSDNKEKQFQKPQHIKKTKNRKTNKARKENDESIKRKQTKRLKKNKRYVNFSDDSDENEEKDDSD